MKKLVPVLYLLFASALLFDSLTATAQTESLEEDIQQTQEKIEQLNAENIRETYLQREWTKVIRDNSATNWIFKANSLFKFLFGYEFNLSWAFLTALLIWLLFFTIFYQPILLIFKKKLLSIGISISFTIIVAQLAIPRIIMPLSKLIKNIWGNLALLLAIIILGLVIHRVLKDLAKQYREKHRESRLKKLEKKSEVSEESKKEIESIAAGAKEMAKGYTQPRKNNNTTK